MSPTCRFPTVMASRCWRLADCTSISRSSACCDSVRAFTSSCWSGPSCAPWSGVVLVELPSAHGTFRGPDRHASTDWSRLQEPRPMAIRSGTSAVNGEYHFDLVGGAPAITVDVHNPMVSDLKLRPGQGKRDYV